MKLTFLIFISVLMICHSYGQYNITSNPKCIAALKNKSVNGDKLLTTATHFFDYSKSGERDEWLRILSKDCFKEGRPDQETRNWWNYLTNSNIKYEILGQAPEIRTNQKYIYFKLWSDEGYKGEKRLVLIDENGSWKVASIDL
jgi:hypothetical protein